jgi:hypothetical protein
VILAAFIVHRNSKIIFHQPITSGQFAPNAELIAGFLSALAAFTDEIGAGNMDYVALENVKFVYKIGKHELLYVFAIEQGDSVEEAADKLRNVRRVFEEKYAAVLKHALENEADFSGFNKNLETLLNISKK